MTDADGTSAHSHRLCIDRLGQKRRVGVVEDIPSEAFQRSLTPTGRQLNDTKVKDSPAVAVAGRHGVAKTIDDATLRTAHHDSKGYVCIVWSPAFNEHVHPRRTTCSKTSQHSLSVELQPNLVLELA